MENIPYSSGTIQSMLSNTKCFFNLHVCYTGEGHPKERLFGVLFGQYKAANSSAWSTNCLGFLL